MKEKDVIERRGKCGEAKLSGIRAQSIGNRAHEHILPSPAAQLQAMQFTKEFGD